MKGVLLISHGPMAQGMAQSATMFLGENIPQFASCGLKPEDHPESFGMVIQQALRQIDSGDGVIILADIMFGTPCNQAIHCLNEKIELITGMNLPMLLQVLTSRKNDDELLQSGRKAVQDVKLALQSFENGNEELDLSLL